MTEFLNPEYLKPRGWWLKYGYPILMIVLVLMLVVVIYLLYREYYTPNYKLTNLLPQDYTMALELKANKEFLPKIQTEKLFANQTLNIVYKQIFENINGELKKLPPSLNQSLLKTKQVVFFLDNNLNWGMIWQLADKEEAKQLESLTITDLACKIIKKQLLLVANKSELIDEMIRQPITPLSPFDFSVSLAPWLTIYLNDSFFNQAFGYQLLTDFQTILQPLQLSDSQNFTLEFLNRPGQLILQLKPTDLKSKSDKTTLDDYLNYLPQEYDLLFGLSDLQQLTKNLETNRRLASYFRQADFLIWLKSQISISRLLKELNNPVILTISDDKWQILTDSSNQEILEGYLRSFLAQFTPIRQVIFLPDGTQATELIADPSSISLETSENQGWGIFSYNHPQRQSKIGYTLKENLMILSNEINNFPNFDFQLECNLAKISEILSFYPAQQNWLKISPYLQNFAKISAISSIDGQIMVCMNLK